MIMDDDRELWYDLTVFGSIYEQQTSNYGRHRYRLLRIGVRHGLDDVSYYPDDEPWTYGRPP